MTKQIVQIEDGWALEVLAQHAAHAHLRHLHRYINKWRAAVLAQQASLQQLSARLHRTRVRSLFDFWLAHASMRHTLRLRFAAWRRIARSARQLREASRGAARHWRRYLTARVFRAWVIVWFRNASAHALQAQRAARLMRAVLLAWSNGTRARSAERRTAAACTKLFTARIVAAWRLAAASRAAAVAQHAGAQYSAGLKRRGLRGLERAVQMRALLVAAARWHASQLQRGCLRSWARCVCLERGMRGLAVRTQRAACAAAFRHWYWSTSGFAAARRFQVLIAARLLLIPAADTC